MVEYAISTLCISLMVSPMASYSGVMKASSRSTTASVTLAAMPHQGASGSAETAARESRVAGEVAVIVGREGVLYD